jgi:hypothetical protein
MRALLLFLIGIAFGGTGGFLASGGLSESSHDHAGHNEPGHGDGDLTAWNGQAPEMTLRLLPDMGNDLNLQIVTDGFTFTPNAVNGPVSAGSGHAHVYVNDEKVARAYSPYVHLKNVPEGATIRVTLNANDHSRWGLNGQPIATEATAP